jgi:hypothetical protein
MLELRTVPVSHCLMYMPMAKDIRICRNSCHSSYIPRQVYRYNVAGQPRTVCIGTWGSGGTIGGQPAG